MFDIFEEIITIGVAAIGPILDAETTGQKGEEKAKLATEAIMKELSDEGGIQIKNKILLNVITVILPGLLKYVVWRLNVKGFLHK